MDQRTEQERMNNIHTGWEKYKELNPEAPISPEFDEMIETRMMEANGLKVPLTKEEQVQAQLDLAVHNYNRMPQSLERMGRIIAQKNPNPANKYIDNFKIFVARTTVIGGLSLGVVGTLALVTTPMGGVVKDFVTAPIKKLIQIDNQKLEDEYKSTSSEVEELTGMSPEEIMEKGRNIH